MTVTEAFSALFAALVQAFSDWWAKDTDPVQKTKSKTLLKWALMFGFVIGGLWYTGYVSRKDLPDSPIAMKEDVAHLKSDLEEIKALLNKKR